MMASHHVSSTPIRNKLGTNAITTTKVQAPVLPRSGLQECWGERFELFR